MKRIVLVHGWASGPDKNWLPWIAEEFKNRGYAILAPQLPDPENPHKDAWVAALAEAVGTVDEETFFLAHSLGSQVMLRYLESLPPGAIVGGVLFVAGFLLPPNRPEGAASDERTESWMHPPLDLKKIRSHLPKSIALFSDNDRWISLDNAEAFKTGLGSEIVIEHERGHLTRAEDTAILAAALRLVS